MRIKVEVVIKTLEVIEVKLEIVYIQYKVSIFEIFL